MELHPYSLFRDEIVFIDRIVIKGKRIIVPASLQDEALKQLHINHMGIEKTRKLACKLIYWANMNADIEETIKNWLTSYNFQAT